VSEPKQVIVIRSDLGMRKGKMIAQGAHASMKVLFDRALVIRSIDGINSHLTLRMDPVMTAWVEGLFTKIVVRAESEKELALLHLEALDAGIPCAMIQDSGKTEFHGKVTYTALAIGPDMPEKIDPITKHLKLW